MNKSSLILIKHKKPFFSMLAGKRRLFTLFLLAFLIWFCIFIAKVFSDMLEINTRNRANELARIKKELNEKRESMEKLNQKEKSTFGELLDLEERLDLAERLNRKLAIEEKSIERELKIEEKSLESTDSKFRFYLERSQKRLREIYKHGRFGSYVMFLEASSPLDLVNRLNLTRRILKGDQKLLRETKNLKAEIEEKEQNLKKKEGELSELRKRKAQEEMVYHRELAEKDRLFKKIKSEKKLYAQAIKELEKNASTLENIIEQINLPEQKTPGKIQPKEERLFDISKGKLPWPIQGKVMAYFGEQRDPQFHSKTKNPGIEIEAEPGKEVLAVADGKVVYSSRLRGYGNLVILEHDGGYYTLYARLSEISVSPGEAVERLQRIGMLGESGFFLGPCLHFEIRKGKQSQDPLEWLR